MSTVTTLPAHHSRALLLGTSAYLFASIFWGMNVPLTTILFDTFDPFFLLSIRIAIATLVLLAIRFAMNDRHGSRLCMSVPRFAMMTLSIAAFFTLYNVGLKYTNTITAAAIMAGSPVYAAVTMRVVSRAPLERGFWGAAALTLIGAAIAIYGRAADSAQALRLQGGEPLIVASIVCWTLYSILSQRWFAPEVPQLQRTYVAMLGATGWLTASWIVLHLAGIAGPANLSPGPEAILWLLMTAVLSSALSIVAWNIGVSRIGLAAGVLWQNTVPVFAVLISMLFGMVPTTGQVIGGAIVLAGVLYMQWQRMRA